MNEVLPPRQVLVSAVILVFVGMSSCVALIFGMFLDALLLDPTILALPLGYGLLVGSEQSRQLARFGAGVVLCVMVAGLTALVVHVANGWPVEGLTWTAAFAGVSVPLLSLIVFLGLRQKRVGDWFSSPRGRPFARSCTLAVSLLAAIYTSHEYVEDREYQAQIASAFPVYTQIELVDAKTGNGIRSVRLSYPERDSFEDRSRLSPFYNPPQLNQRTRFNGDGTEVTFEGVLFEPEEITVGAEGYEIEVVKLDRTTERRIHLRMVPDESEATD